MMTEASQEDAIRDHDIQALLEAGVCMIDLEDLYGAKVVHQVAETYITNHDVTSAEENEDNNKDDDRRTKLATLLFLRAPSSSTKAIMKSHDVVDAVFAALVADPDDPLLMDPLLHTVLHDPVVLSSGIVVDRSTALDPTTGQLRLTKCPFRRIPLKLPVYEIYPLQEKIRAYEHDRLERCVSVAQTFLKEGDYDRAERVFTIANDFLQEHQWNYHERLNLRSKMVENSQSPAMAAVAMGIGNGNVNNNNNNNNTQEGTEVMSTYGNYAPQKYYAREILLLALQLAQLERELPQVKDDILRSVAIHRRLINVARVCSADKQDTETLIVACLEDCWKRCSLILALAEGSIEASYRALIIRQSFSPLITYTLLLQLNLTEKLQKLCQLDLRLAKDVEDEPCILNCRRLLMKLLPESEKTNFLESEGITNDKKNLSCHLFYDATAWPGEKFLDPTIGLAHFGNLKAPVESSLKSNGEILPMTQTRGITCWANLNPAHQGDHWIEVAFRMDILPSSGGANPVLSQLAKDSGWEIRCISLTKPKFPFGIGFEKEESQVYVECVWTTTDGSNAMANTKVPLEVEKWYHVVLVYSHEASTMSLYINGVPTRKKAQGNFVPARGLPRLGEVALPMDRRFCGWVAFGGGGYELPVNGKDTSALDNHVRELTKDRLVKLPSHPALQKLASFENY